MPGTTMYLVKAALVDRVKAADMDGVTVLFGPKQSTTFTAGKVISFGDIRWTRAAATMDDFGAEPAVDESYDVDCTIECTVTGTRQDRATRQACELFDEVDALFRVRDETLGVPGVLYARLVGDGRVMEAKDHSTLQVGRSAVIPFLIRVMGVI